MMEKEKNGEENVRPDEKANGSRGFNCLDDSFKAVQKSRTLLRITAREKTTSTSYSGEYQPKKNTTSTARLLKY
ncbi:hypothetical protein HPP92_003942 [Vanilla planifolia]|uniref:Uncharacterized protein n=1 Tax=Vanilla planifolia TaxID=51239 RepID=A0A835S3Y1_VANPL|nr:hypothetical protein HPP92_003942 [Vanilla planifolia]